MNHSQFIEVGIGLVFVFLLMSIMVSAGNEFITTVISKRGKFLRKALGSALNDPQNMNYAELLYDHPLIDTLKFSQKRPPAYISSATFAMALTEVIASQAKKSAYKVQGDRVKLIAAESEIGPFDEFRNGLAAMNESSLKSKLESFVKNSNGNYDLLKALIENWFNEYMDRVSGWYRRKCKWINVVLAACLTLFMNVDTIDLSVNLWNNAVLRESVVAASEGFANEYKFENDGKNDTILDQKIAKIKETYRKIGILSLPIGWDKQSEQVTGYHEIFEAERLNIKTDNERNFISKFFSVQGKRIKFYWRVLCVYWETVSPMKILGWLFTTLAVSFGAPYWFEFLKRLLAIRTMTKGNALKTKE